tara:strand:+ start:327 stop:542 length:216 start_codon:yes stop_codon:yes gene_type:complete
MNCLHCSQELNNKEEVQVRLTMLSCPCCESIVFVLKEKENDNDNIITQEQQSGKKEKPQRSLSASKKPQDS